MTIICANFFLRHGPIAADLQLLIAMASVVSGLEILLEVREKNVHRSVASNAECFMYF